MISILVLAKNGISITQQFYKGNPTTVFPSVTMVNSEASDNNSSPDASWKLPIEESYINVTKLARGDGKTDDTLALQMVFEKAFSLNKKVIIDFDGADYLISKPLILPKGQNVTLQNGRLIASENFPEDGFLVNSGRAGKEGTFANEDLRFDNLVFDNMHRGGGLHLESYNRVIVNGSIFKHFKTIGLYLGKVGNPHEAIIDSVYFHEYTWDEWMEKKDSPPRFGTALSVDSNDNHFSKIVVGLAKKGIEVRGQYNQFDNLHVWGCEEQGIHIASSFVGFNQLYLDGVQVQIDDPWHVEISNSKFFAHIANPEWSFIVLKPTRANLSVSGLKIQGSSFHNTVPTIKGISIDTSQGSFNNAQIKQCYLDDNSFSNVKAFASKTRKVLQKSGARDWVFDFSDIFPFGSIQSVTYSFMPDEENTFLNTKVKGISGNVITLSTESLTSGKFWVEADVILTE